MEHVNAARRQVEGEDNIQSTTVTSTKHVCPLLRIPQCPQYQISQEIRVKHAVHPNIYSRLFVKQLRSKKADAESNINDNKGISTRCAVLSILAIFCMSAVAVLYTYSNFPDLEENEREHIKLPWSIEDAQKLGIVLDRYKDRYFFEVLTGICVVYIFLQTFAIPGSLFLSILSGFLFPFLLALCLISVCSAIGASLCFLLSQLFGRRIVQMYMPQRAADWSETINKHKDNLFNYMLFLRITPFLPNWFINLVAPVVGVPLLPFALGTFFGVMPPSFIAIQTGKTLHNLSATSSVSWSSMAVLGTLAVGSLIPVLAKGKLKEKFQ